MGNTIEFNKTVLTAVLRIQARTSANSVVLAKILSKLNESSYEDELNAINDITDDNFQNLLKIYQQ